MSIKIMLTCPWCGLRFAPEHHRQQFCTPAHSKAYSNQQLSEGQRINALAKAWRLGRNIKKPTTKLAKAKKEASKLAFAMLCQELDALASMDGAAGRVDALTVFYRRSSAGLLDFQGPVNRKPAPQGSQSDA